MEIPKITLSATDIKDIGKKIATLKESTDINAFIIDMHQPFYLQDRSDGGHDEIICVIPQHGARGAGERRAREDIDWLTYVAGCAIGVDSVGVLWGYGDRGELEDEGATHIVASTNELRQLLVGWISLYLTASIL